MRFLPTRSPWRPLALAALILLLAAPARSAEPDSGAAGLGPTSDVPWNPPRALSPNEPWEAAVRFPGRVVSLPLAAVGQGVRVSLRAAEQGFIIQKTLYLLGGVRLPVMIGPADLGERTGFGIGTGVRPVFGPVAVPVGYQFSFDQYTRFGFGLDAGVAALEYANETRPKDRFYGLGMDTRLDDESRFGLHEERVRLALRMASDLRGGRGPSESLELWAGPRWSRLTRGFESDDPSIGDVFPAGVAGTLDRSFEHFTWGARLGADRTGGRPHWTRGWRASVSAERFDRPVVESPSRTGAQFTRWRWDGEAGVSFRRDPRTLRLRIGVVDQNVTGGADRFLVSDLERLGGSRALSGYEAQRFQDVDRVDARLSWIFPLSALFEFDVHGDTGGAFAHLSEDLKPNRLRQSAGAALRIRTPASVIAMLGFDASPEQTRMVFAIGSEP